jgi:hypothetical protein
MYSNFIQCKLLFLLIFSHAAASYGEMEVLEYLLSVGADVKLKDEDGDTPLLVCEEPAIFDRLVLAGADPKAINKQKQGILEKAVEDDNETLILHLQAKGYITDPNFKYTPPTGESDDENLNLDMIEEGDNEEDEDKTEDNNGVSSEKADMDVEDAN